jgi:glycosyltransferase involved in cell wall biosynthesis
MRQYAGAARHEPWIEPPIHPQGNSSPFLFTPIHAPNEPPSIRIVPIDIPMTPRPRKLKILRWLPSSLVTTTGARAGRNLYLTFDDGPDAEHTAPLLELLARHQAKASFFLIGRQIEAHPEHDIRFVPQTGKGKGDAVRTGFAAAKHDVLMILDGDLSVLPEDLPKFHRGLVDGRAELVNGSRLVYDMEAGAMRFLNMIGNRAFRSLVKAMIGQQIGDTLIVTSGNPGTGPIATTWIAKLA